MTVEESVIEAQQLLDGFGTQLESIGADPSADVTPLREFVVDEYFDRLEDGFASMRQQGERLSGHSVYGDIQPLRFAPDGSGEVLVCQDIREVRLLDVNGNDLTPPSRPGFRPMRVSFEKTSRGLLIADSRYWEGSDAC